MSGSIATPVTAAGALPPAGGVEGEWVGGGVWEVGAFVGVLLPWPSAGWLDVVGPGPRPLVRTPPLLLGLSPPLSAPVPLPPTGVFGVDPDPDTGR
ncbi:hypothetical protein [Catenulispora pinisilvae]|uniref:hypothetical protein n=1 Tax=Catenulispora pinisilvae TaxID=2705253 RepID=UPI00189119F6|nr:hypothetical protein [Catenulispora pinisilvae]